MDKRSDAISKLRNFCDSGFGGSSSEAALVLGRETSEIEQMLEGSLSIDEDLEMKMNGIAEERDIEIGANAKEQ